MIKYLCVFSIEFTFFVILFGNNKKFKNYKLQETSNIQ